MKQCFIMLAFLFCVSSIFANNTNPVTSGSTTTQTQITVVDLIGTDLVTPGSTTTQTQITVVNLPKAEPLAPCRQCTPCKGVLVCIWCDCSNLQNCDFSALSSALCAIGCCFSNM
jgi:hypothetical protein